MIIRSINSGDFEYDPAKFRVMRCGDRWYALNLENFYHYEISESEFEKIYTKRAPVIDNEEKVIRAGIIYLDALENKDPRAWAPAGCLRDLIRAIAIVRLDRFGRTEKNIEKARRYL